MVYQSNPIPHKEPWSGPGGLTPGSSESSPGTFFENHGYSDSPYPSSMQDEYERAEKRPKLELSIYNVMLSVIAVFLLAVSILIVVTTQGVVDNSTGMRTFDTTYTVPDPTIDTVVGTGYFQLTSLNVQYYDGAWHPIGPVGYTYDSVSGSITIPPASINAFTTSIQVTGTRTLAEPPTMSVFSILGAALIVLSIFAIIGTLWFRNRF